jgi:hypothetical protein
MVLIELGLISVYAYIRSLSCQILSNNLSVLAFHCYGRGDNGGLEQRMDRVIGICINLAISPIERVSVKVEISYLIISFL